MSTNDYFTSLPTATPELTDIICAVQGYSSPTVLGTSVQETLADVATLLSSQVIQTSAGDPNGVLTGAPYNLAWDSVNNMLYVCTDAGISNWMKAMTLTAGQGISITQNGALITISSSALGLTYRTVTTATEDMVTNSIYFINYSGGTAALTLPLVSNPGDGLIIMGNSVGGWSVAQGAAQQIFIGASYATYGATGSIASTNRYDSIQLICTTANSTWQAPSGPQGNITIV